MIYGSVSRSRKGDNVQKHIIAFASVTFANKAKTVLNKAGHSAEIRRTPANIAHGCGYSVLTDAPSAALIKLMEDNKIPYKTVSEVK